MKEYLKYLGIMIGIPLSLFLCFVLGNWIYGSSYEHPVHAFFTGFCILFFTIPTIMLILKVLLIMFNNVGGEDYDNHEFKQEPPKHEDNYFRR